MTIYVRNNIFSRFVTETTLGISYCSHVTTSRYRNVGSF